MKKNDLLKNKIKQKTVLAGIVGIGYVGSALAEAASDAGFRTIGFDIDQRKVETTNGLKKKNLSATSDMSILSRCDIICICVPTPVYEDKTPDFRYMKAAARSVAKTLRRNQLITLESSVNPGATRTIILPILEATGLRAGKDFFLSFSPERIDPGNKQFRITDIPKVVGGYDEVSRDLSVAFYSQIIKQVIPVSSLETAELVKILENTYRLVNISLINEVSEYAKAIGVDMWEVISAAATKPFGFQAHYPGPGAGGHCIPVDPYYLVEDAAKLGINLRIIKQAGKTNDRQPKKVVKKTLEILKQTNGKKKEHKVLLVGLSYKPDIDDVRESPALKIWELFEKRGITVSYHDPYVSQMNGSTSVELSKETISDHDMIVITTNHSRVSYDKLAKYNTPIIDTRNVYKNERQPHIFKV